MICPSVQHLHLTHTPKTKDSLVIVRTGKLENFLALFDADTGNHRKLCSRVNVLLQVAQEDEAHKTFSRIASHCIGGGYVSLIESLGMYRTKSKKQREKKWDPKHYDSSF
jgi:hypothetical protein